MRLLVTRPDGTATSTPLVFTAGLSQPVALPGSPLNVAVTDAAPAGTAWVVTHAGRPGGDRGDAAARLGAAGEPALLALFGADPAEPYLTWRNLWQSDAPLPYRLGAALLALAARTGEVKAAGG